MQYKFNKMQAELDEVKKETKTISQYVKLLESKIASELKHGSGHHSVQNPQLANSSSETDTNNVPSHNNHEGHSHHNHNHHSHGGNHNPVSSTNQPGANNQPNTNKPNQPNNARPNQPNNANNKTNNTNIPDARDHRPNSSGRKTPEASNNRKAPAVPRPKQPENSNSGEDSDEEFPEQPQYHQQQTSSTRRPAQNAGPNRPTQPGVNAGQNRPTQPARPPQNANPSPSRNPNPSQNIKQPTATSPPPTTANKKIADPPAPKKRFKPREEDETEVQIKTSNRRPVSTPGGRQAVNNARPVFPAAAAKEKEETDHPVDDDIMADMDTMSKSSKRSDGAKEGREEVIPKNKERMNRTKMIAAAMQEKREKELEEQKSKAGSK